MILDAVQTVLGPFGFDRTVYSGGHDDASNFNKKNKVRRGNKWYEELRKERMKDIRTEMS